MWEVDQLELLVFHSLTFNSSHHRAVSNNIFTAGWTPDDAPTQILHGSNATYIQLYQKNWNEDSSSLPVSAFNTGEK